MQRARLGCLTGTGIIATLITAFAIVGYSLASGGGQMFSPGALNAIHGQLLGGVTSHADIAGACSACHVAPWEPQTMDDRCLVCHTDVPAQMLDIQTPHGRMHAIDPEAQCRACHPEHRGALASLVDIAGWRYPHQLSGYLLDAHQFKAENDPFKCEDCHGNDVTTFNVETCAACHGQMDQTFTTNHIIAYGASCLDCHDGKDSLGKSFTHANFSFQLTGKHELVACENCHTNKHNLDGFKTTAQACSTCHVADDPHQGAMGSDCAACHTPDDWKTVHFDHNLAAFKLTDTHLTVACEKCHINSVLKGTPQDCFACHKQDDRHLGELGTDCAACHKPTKWTETTFNHSLAAFPLTGKHVTVLCLSCHKNGTYKNTPVDCASCHIDVHSGQMGKDCASCHNTGDWKDVTFDHGKTGFPLSGSHKSAACAECHINGVYKGTPKNCYACHASKDAHKGQFGTDCGSCHNPSSWKNVSFDHSKTGFQLSGLHTNVQCSACHANNVFKGTPKNCYACHAAKDAHAGQFGTDCASCHNPSGWKNVSFDHGKTAFPLLGSHTTVKCSACHVNNVFKGTPKNCYACHAAKDAHGGQFGTDCASCHSPSNWKTVSFDHGKTAFPLTGGHTSVQCKACHTNGVYKGTPKDCYACHAAKDKHNGQFGTVCSTCHNTSGWKNVTFNHGNTAFPLAGSHANVACGACHINGVYKGTPKDCYACHAAKDKHNGQFGTACGSCHKPTQWSDVTFNHSNTAFPLSGLHTNVQCAACHTNGIYKGTPTNCYACHAAKDNHNGQFGTDCGACHNPSGWANATFNHNNTAFPLIGHHTNLNCSKCHSNGVYKGTSTQCIACHRDEHNGQNGTDCSICHTPKDWGAVIKP